MGKGEIATELHCGKLLVTGAIPRQPRPEAAGRLLPPDDGTTLDSRLHLAGTRRRAM
jgi:hypothetical protein